MAMETGDEHLHIEDRRESIIFSERKEIDAKAKHIFNYGDGMVEISKEFLKKMLNYLNSHPDIVKNWEEQVR